MSNERVRRGKGEEGGGHFGGGGGVEREDLRMEEGQWGSVKGQEV